MPYNFVVDIFHTNFAAISSSEVRFWTEFGRFAFLSLRLPLGDFGATYEDFLLVLIELFFSRSHG